MPQSSLLRVAHKLPYLPGGGWLLDLWGSCAVRRCWQKAPTTEPTADLSTVVNPAFCSALLTAAFQSIDKNNNGSVDFTEFSAFFSAWASPPELRVAFDLIDSEGSGQVTLGMLREFQEQFSPDTDNFGGKVGDPAYLEYANLLMGIKLSCERRVFMEVLTAGSQPLPPEPAWLLEMMGREWQALPCLEVHWDYVMQPVPLTAEGRRFPNWKGGFSIRDDGHEGMTVEDFLALPQAQAAKLTLPEVVGLRLYTGPGYELLNRSLRANTQRFPVTEFCIDSAVGKLALVHQPQVLLRGLRKKMHPRWRRRYQVYRGVGKKDVVLCDPGFVSTTTDVAVATGADFGGPVVFVVRAKSPIVGRVGFVSDGAAVDWVSQYTTEAEVLLPSNSIFVPCIQCKHPDPNPLPIPPQKSKYHFHVYFPWNFDCNMPFVAQDYLDCANFLLHHVHQCEVEFLQDCKQGHPVAPRLSEYLSLPLVPHGASPFPSFCHPPEPTFLARNRMGGEDDGSKERSSRARLLPRWAREQELCLVPDDEWWFAESPLPNSPSSLQGTSAVKLAAVRLYTRDDVEQLERSLAPRPTTDDGLGPLPPSIAETYGPRHGHNAAPPSGGAVRPPASTVPFADTVMSGNGADSAAGRAWAPFPATASVHHPFERSPWDMNRFLYLSTGVAHRLGAHRVAASSRLSMLLGLLFISLLLTAAVVPAVVVTTSGGARLTQSSAVFEASPSPTPSPLAVSPSPSLVSPSPSPAILGPGQCLQCKSDGTISWPVVASVFDWPVSTCNTTLGVVTNAVIDGIIAQSNCMTSNGSWSGSIGSLSITPWLLLQVTEVSKTSLPLWVGSDLSGLVLEVCLASSSMPASEFKVPIIAFPNSSGACSNPWEGTACPVKVKLSSYSYCSVVFDTEVD